MSVSIVQQVTARAAAKVNLELAVGPLRADGYHELSTVFQAVGLYDDVTVTAADDFSCVVEGRQADEVPLGEDNLVVKAARRLAELHDVDRAVAIAIRKDIPVAGGMAGGSADAAATLVACDALWGLGLSKEELCAVGAELGSDVPFSVLGGTAVGTGRGEKLAPVLARGTYHWVFAFSAEGLSTPAVFAECDRLRAEHHDAGARDPMLGHSDVDLLAALRSGDAARLGAALRNDLTDAALSLQPSLRETLEIGHECGALGQVVSGSGPTIAFLASDHEHALDLAVALTASGVAADARRAHGPVAGARLFSPARDS